MAKPAVATKEASKSQMSFEALLEKTMETFVPPRRGRDETPELRLVKEKYDSLKKGVEKGIPFKTLVELLNQSENTNMTDAQLRSRYMAVARARGEAPPPKKREKKPEAATPAE